MPTFDDLAADNRGRGQQVNAARQPQRRAVDTAASGRWRPARCRRPGATNRNGSPWPRERAAWRTGTGFFSYSKKAGRGGQWFFNN